MFSPKEPFLEPESMAFTPRNFADKPMWVQNRKNSRHGVDVPFGNRVDMATIYRQYMETLLAVDDSVGRLVETLRQKGVLESTLTAPDRLLWSPGVHDRRRSAA